MSHIMHCFRIISTIDTVVSIQCTREIWTKEETTVFLSYFPTYRSDQEPRSARESFTIGQRADPSNGEVEKLQRKETGGRRH